MTTSFCEATPIQKSYDFIHVRPGGSIYSPSSPSVPVLTLPALTPLPEHQLTQGDHRFVKPLLPHTYTHAHHHHDFRHCSTHHPPGLLLLLRTFPFTHRPAATDQVPFAERLQPLRLCWQRVLYQLQLRMFSLIAVVLEGEWPANNGCDGV